MFAQRKAERATVRMHLRDKYHLAQVRTSLSVDLGVPLDPTSRSTALGPRLPCSPGWEGFLKRAADGHCLHLTICHTLSTQRLSLALDSPGIHPCPSTLGVEVLCPPSPAPPW